MVAGEPPPDVAAAADILRPGLLDGTRAAARRRGDPPSRFGEAVDARCADVARGRWTASSSTPPATRSTRARPTCSVWDGASLAGPRDVLDGAWLALPPDRATARGSTPQLARRQAAADRPAAGRRRRRGGPRRDREPRAHACRSSGRATGSAPRRCCPARPPTRRGRRARRLPRLARGRLLLRLPLPAWSMSERWRVTSLDAVGAAARAGHAAVAAGSARARDRRVRYQRLPRRGTPATTSVEPHTEEGTGHEELYFVAPRLRHVHARRRDRPRARRHLRLPAGSRGRAPRGRRRAGHGGVLVRRLARPRLRGLRAGSRASAPPRSASRTRSRRASSTRRGWPATRTAQWAHYDLACWHALPTATSTEAPAAARPRDRARRRRGARAVRARPRPRAAALDAQRHRLADGLRAARRAQAPRPAGRPA